MKTEKILSNIIPLLILILISTFSLIVSYQANHLQADLTAYMSFVFTLNNVTYTLFPFILFTFFFLTIKISLSIFENKINSNSLYKIICYSFIPLLLHIIFYTFNFIEYTKDLTLKSDNDFYKIKYAFGLTTFDFEKLSLLAWAFVFISMIYLLHKKEKIPFINSSISVLAPSLIVLFMKSLF